MPSIPADEFPVRLDETPLVRFRQRLREDGQQERLPGLVNRQLEARGLIRQTCSLVDATLPAAARCAHGPALGLDPLPARAGVRLVAAPRRQYSHPG